MATSPDDPLSAPVPPVAELASLEPRRKAARFRAWHRGIREMDLIMGRFADREIATLSEAELDQFEALLEEAETVVYGWIAGREPVPAAFDHALFARLKVSAHPD